MSAEATDAVLLDVDGTPVCNVSFDLSAVQLAAAAHVVESVLIRRHRGAELDTDDVLAMRELTGIADELQRLADHEAHGTLVLPLARFTALHDALGEWIQTSDDRGWMREDDAERHPIIAALLGPMADLRADALRVAALRQVSQGGQWVAAPVQASTTQKLEDIILTKARDLRRASLAS